MRWRDVVIVEHSAAGHHPTYLAAIIDALAGLDDCRLCVLAPEELLHAPSIRLRIKNHAVRCAALPRLPGYKNLRVNRASWLLFNVRRLRVLGRTLADMGHRPNATLAFFPTLYDNNFFGFQATRSFFPFEVGGIYMTSTFFRDPALYERQCVGRKPRFLADRRTAALAVLDEGILAALQSYAPSAVVGAVPEFVNLEVGSPPECWHDIRRQAQGKPVIGLFGYLKRSKGLLRLLSIANERAVDAWFVAAGELPCNDYTERELAELTRASERPEIPFSLVQGRVRDESAFQGLVAAVDVVYCGYEGFLSSSNQVALAFALGKPAIVAPDGCMAAQAQGHPLGILLRGDGQGDVVQAITSALERRDRIRVPPEPNEDWPPIATGREFSAALRKLVTAAGSARPRAAGMVGGLGAAQH